MTSVEQFQNRVNELHKNRPGDSLDQQYNSGLHHATEIACESILSLEKRIKELEEMLKPAAETNYRLIQQCESMIHDVHNLRSAIGVSVPACLRVLLKLLPADAEVDRQMTEAVLKRVETAMNVTERYCAVHETVIIENAFIQVVKQ